MAGRDDKGDNAADRDAGNRDLVQVERIEETLDRRDEQVRVIARPWNVRITVPRVVQCIDGATLR